VSNAYLYRLCPAKILTLALAPVGEASKLLNEARVVETIVGNG
jgi:hypothetical protein